jgi:poly(A) polymerase
MMLTANKKIINKLENLPFIATVSSIADKMGVEVYVVGGYVRDILLNREKKEVDLLVVGNGPEFAQKIAASLGIKNVSIFKNFGTAQFNYEDYVLEFVGARKESYSKKSRNPRVTTGTFEDDINRRDFTINTLAVSLVKENFGEIIDTFGGLQDLDKKLVKTPLDPEITFSDDPLRMMRAIRFASQLQFEVAPEVIDASKKLKERLKTLPDGKQVVSQERIIDEFLKILGSPQPSVGLKLLYETGILEIIFPEIANLAGVDQRKDYHHKDVFFHTLQVVDNISLATEDIWLRFAALVHDIAKPQTKKFVEGIGWTFHGHEELGARIMKHIFKRMKLPFNKQSYVEKLVRLHLRPMALAREEVTDSAIRRFIVDAGEDLEDLITLCRADITSKDPQKVSEYLENYERVMKKVWEVEEKDKLRAFQSPVRGDEIMKVCNLKPSKKVGEIKKAIEDAILEGKIGNNYEEAYEYLLRIKDEYSGEKV